MRMGRRGWKLDSVKSMLKPYMVKVYCQMFAKDQMGRTTSLVSLALSGNGNAILFPKLLYNKGEIGSSMRLLVNSL